MNSPHWSQINLKDEQNGNGSSSFSTCGWNTAFCPVAYARHQAASKASFPSGHLMGPPPPKKRHPSSTAWDSAPSFHRVIQSSILRAKTQSFEHCLGKNIMKLGWEPSEGAPIKQSPSHPYSSLHLKLPSALHPSFISPHSVEKASRQISVQDSISKEREGSLH